MLLISILRIRRNNKELQQLHYKKKFKKKISPLLKKHAITGFIKNNWNKNKSVDTYKTSQIPI